MTDLELQIKDAIAKNLPLQVGEALQQRLKKADEDEKKLKAASELLISKDETILSLRAKVEEYQKLDDRNAALEKREEAVKLTEIRQELETYKYQLKVEKEKSEFVVGVTQSLVRNAVYRKTIFDSEMQQSYMGPNNQMIYPAPTAKNHIETQTEE